MSADIDNILLTASQRAQHKALTYAGEVTPEEAYQLQQAGVPVVDVRYPFEHEYVGRPPSAIPIPWRTAPDGPLNSGFVKALAKVVQKHEPVLLLCRSGVRSHAAAAHASAHGFSGAYNIIGGFEGDLDHQQHRSTISGWRVARLPWVQN